MGGEEEDEFGGEEMPAEEMPISDDEAAAEYNEGYDHDDLNLEAIIRELEGMDHDGMPEDEMPEGVDGGDPIQIELMEMLKDFMKKMAEKMSQMEQKMYSVENEFNAFKKEPAAKKIANIVMALFASYNRSSKKATNIEPTIITDSITYLEINGSISIFAVVVE
jgi:hypothetical protein